jgi:hypothetical protein
MSDGDGVRAELAGKGSVERSYGVSTKPLANLFDGLDKDAPGSNPINLTFAREAG